ncbi:MAG: DUF1552 domain-containing protein [Pirellulaceae bacterium]
MTTRLSRRTVLRGLSCAMSLPLFDAMLPRTLVAAEPTGSKSKPPVRMAFISFPNGAIMPAWRPEGKGTSFELKETLAPLSDVKSHLTIISGLAQDNGRAKGDGPGDHARSASSLLTGAHPVKTSGANIKVGASVDQVAAAKAGTSTRHPSLEIGTERGRDAGGCDSGYACAYSNNISWKTESTPMAKEINPRLVFERLFGAAKKDDEEQARRSRTRQSVLDLVAEDAAALKVQLGQTDRRKLDEYLTSVREIERRIVQAETLAQKERPDFKTPGGIPDDIQEHIRLMYDLLTLAFRTDTTRVATYMLANEGSNRSYKNVGVSSGHHEISHHRNDKDKIDQLKKIDLFLAGELARFLKNLQEIKEGNGSLLDNCMIMYGSGLSDGNRHNHDDLPIVLAGRAGGSLQSGRHIVLEKETPLNNLFLSMLDRMEAGVPSLGDSTGRLSVLDT